MWQLDKENALSDWDIGQVNITGRDVIISVQKDPNVNGGFAAVDEFFFDRDVDTCKTKPAEAEVHITTTTSSPKSGRSSLGPLY